jgi:ubiquinone/menaquinone biosynthesis C-methylase UbiE
MHKQIVVNARDLYTTRAVLYGWWMSLFRQQRGLENFFERSGCLRPDLRILDAGCGSGAATLALVAALERNHFSYRSIDAFDLTPAMLERFRTRLNHLRVERVHLREANVLALDDQLPESWTDYELIVSTFMLEYLPPEQLETALAAVSKRLARDGRLIVVITRKNPIAKVMVEWTWKAKGYTAGELRAAFECAGFASIAFHRFPLPYFWLNPTNHVVVAGHAC